MAGNSTSGSGFELGKFASESYELCNDTTTGTIVNGLAVLTTAGCAARPSSALTSGAIGVVINNSGTSGVVTLARAGSAYCSFDGSATVVGDYVVPSVTASGGFYPLCHDAGATRPTGTQILGRVLQASAGSATVQMFLDMPGSNVSSSGLGAGSCTNQAVTAVLTGGPTCTTTLPALVDFVDRSDGIAGADGNADSTDSSGRRQLDEDCDHGLCEVGDLPGMVVRGRGHNRSDPVLQLDRPGRVDRDGV